MPRLTIAWKAGSPAHETYLTSEPDEGAQDCPKYTASYEVIAEAASRIGALVEHVKRLG